MVLREDLSGEEKKTRTRRRGEVSRRRGTSRREPKGSVAEGPGEVHSSWDGEPDIKKTRNYLKERDAREEKQHSGGTRVTPLKTKDKI